MEEQFGLNYSMAEFRPLDPQLGRWIGIDPLAEKFYHSSPYVAFANNPIYFVDPSGLLPGIGGGEDQPASKTLGVPSDTKVKNTSNAEQKIEGAIRAILGGDDHSNLEEKQGEKYVGEGPTAILANKAIIKTGTNATSVTEIDGSHWFDDYNVYTNVKILGMKILPNPSAGEGTSVATTTSESSSNEVETTDAYKEGMTLNGGAVGGEFETTETESNKHAAGKSVTEIDGETWYEYNVELQVQVGVLNEQTSVIDHRVVSIRAAIRTQANFTPTELEIE
jgi:RHS repeat-associated protein